MPPQGRQCRNTHIVLLPEERMEETKWDKKEDLLLVFKVEKQGQNDEMRHFCCLFHLFSMHCQRGQHSAYITLPQSVRRTSFATPLSCTLPSFIAGKGSSLCKSSSVQYNFNTNFRDTSQDPSPLRKL